MAKLALRKYSVLKEKEENALRWREQPTLLNASERSNKRSEKSVLCVSGMDIISDMSYIHGEVEAEARLDQTAERMNKLMDRKEMGTVSIDDKLIFLAMQRRKDIQGYMLLDQSDQNNTY